MKYKNYTAKATFDEKAKVFHGEVIDLQDTITFQSNRADRLEAEFRKSVDEYLTFCQQMGRAPEKPFSGRFVLRIPPDPASSPLGACRRGGQKPERSDC